MKTLKPFVNEYAYDSAIAYTINKYFMFCFYLYISICYQVSQVLIINDTDIVVQAETYLRPASGMMLLHLHEIVEGIYFLFQFVCLFVCVCIYICVCVCVCMSVCVCV